VLRMFGDGKTSVTWRRWHAMHSGRAFRMTVPGSHILVQAIMSAIDDYAERETLAGLRDRALLLIGFAGAFRRSELVALDVADIEENETGLLVTIRRGKTDQEGIGRTIAIPRGEVACPVKALRAWLEAAAIDAGPIFRPIAKGGTVQTSRLTCRSVANLVKAYAARAGLDASTYSGHSLRSGFLTSAAAKGASIFKMMDQSGHKSVDTLRGYVRDAELFKDHAGTGLL
jgi:site-specific recombinase XerD